MACVGVRVERPVRLVNEGEGDGYTVAIPWFDLSDDCKSLACGRHIAPIEPSPVRCHQDAQEAGMVKGERVDYR